MAKAGLTMAQPRPGICSARGEDMCLYTHTVGSSKTALELPQMLLGPLPGSGLCSAPLSAPLCSGLKQPGTHRAAKHLHGFNTGQRHLLPSGKGCGPFPVRFAKAPSAQAMVPAMLPHPP